MKQDERIPIEPLSDSSWNRVERALFEELDDRARSGASRPSSIAPRVGLPRWALVAIAAVVLLQGAVAAMLWLRSDRGGSSQLASTRFTSGASASEALIGDVAIRLEPGSALVAVADAGNGSLCVLERGAVRFSVPPRGSRPAFVVQAGDTRVEVIGTQFRVERIAGSARVETFEGKVRVSARGETRLVARGETWSPAPVPGSDQAVRVPGVQGELPAAEPAQRVRFEQAAAREATEPGHALRIYRGLAQESGPWAQNALYAAARLELELGHSARAERALRSYLQRHPQGANAADARALLQRLTRKAPEESQP